MNMEKKHTPVLIKSILEHLPIGKHVFVDATLGLGGYIDYLNKEDRIERALGIDCDPENMKEAQQNLKEVSNVSFHLGNFENIDTIVKKKEFDDADIFIFDLGLCSTHIDDEKRGFSFQKEGPLDMRFGGSEKTAYDVVNFTDKKVLENLLREYGEERLARYIADEIVNHRKKKKIETTKELAKIIEDVYTKRGMRRGKRHPATKTFQAIRIEVNRELEVLETALNKTIKIMKKGARIYVITYHSLEDRLTKNILRDAKKEGVIKLINKKVIVPTKEEIQNNPRARSAKLRIAEKIV
jgi:16S rRNA (cytosine1402-N4)-methyltransferase